MANATEDEEQKYLWEILEESRLSEATNELAFPRSEISLTETSDEEQVLCFEISFEDLILPHSDFVVEIILGPSGTTLIRPENTVAVLETPWVSTLDMDR